MDRFLKAGQPHPLVLYTDRDCCKKDEDSKYQRLFYRWDKLLVRLDSWHFMRRLSKACTNESHPLYGTFMAKVDQVHYAYPTGFVNALRMLPPAGTPEK